MNVLKNKLVLGFLIFVLAISVGIGITVWHYGSTYEKTAAVYMRKLDWVLPLNSNYSQLLYDEEEELYRGWNREKTDWIDANGQVVKSDPTDKKVIEIESESLGHGFYTFSEDYALGVKNSDGEIIIPAEHQQIFPYQDGYCIALHENGYEMIYDISGKLLKEGGTDYHYLSNNKFSVETEDGFEIFDLKTGESWTSYHNRQISEVFKLDNHTFAIGFGMYTMDEYVTDYILFDDNMKPILEDKQFTQINRLSEDMRFFITSERSFDGKPVRRECGFMNKDGEIVFLFDHIPRCVNDYSEGLSIVYDEKKLYALDKQGNIVFSHEYTGDSIAASQRTMMENYEVITPYYVEFNEGFAPVTLNGEKWGYIDTTGKFVIEPYFSEVSTVQNGIAVVCDTRSPTPSSLVHSRWGILKLKGGQ